jgi:hypothetical protein
MSTSASQGRLSPAPHMSCPTAPLQPPVCCGSRCSALLLDHVQPPLVQLALGQAVLPRHRLVQVTLLRVQHWALLGEGLEDLQPHPGAGAPRELVLAVLRLN